MLLQASGLVKGEREPLARQPQHLARVQRERLAAHEPEVRLAVRVAERAAEDLAFVLVLVLVSLDTILIP